MKIEKDIIKLIDKIWIEQYLRLASTKDNENIFYLIDTLRIKKNQLINNFDFSEFDYYIIYYLIYHISLCLPTIDIILLNELNKMDKKTFSQWLIFSSTKKTI
jgi:hypothetical protein